MAAPAASQTRASSGALSEDSSKPARSLTVTGSGSAARTTACTMRPASAGSRIRALPSPFPTILRTGQPMLISTAAGMTCPARPRKSPDASRAAASAMTSGSCPNSWTAMGISSGMTDASSPDMMRDGSGFRIACSRHSAFADTISLTVYAAPKRRHTRRKERSVTPAMGASASPSRITTFPHCTSCMVYRFPPRFGFFLCVIVPYSAAIVNRGCRLLQVRPATQTPVRTDFPTAQVHGSPPSPGGLSFPYGEGGWGDILPLRGRGGRKAS